MPILEGSPQEHQQQTDESSPTLCRLPSRGGQSQVASGQSTGSVTSRHTGRFTIEDAEDLSFSALPGGSVSIRRKETMDELDIDPVPEFACPWQSSSSCCDMPTTSENVLRDASPKKIDESRSANGDFDRAQLTVKVPRRIGRFDVVEATPRAGPARMSSGSARNCPSLAPLNTLQILQTLEELNQQVRTLCDRNTALEEENALLRSRCAKFIEQLHELGASSVDLQSPECRVAITRSDTPTETSYSYKW
uniref:Uncharacterized protein n=2 Tax=Perkinsus marinus TaxID=31276 RepID=A7YXR7_9ALVE|nr:unknown [Perkinsus marinus]